MSVHLHIKEIDGPDTQKHQQSGVDKGSSDAADQEVVRDQEVRLLDQCPESRKDFSDGL